MKAKQQSSLRRVLCPRTLIALGIIVLFSCSPKALAQQQWTTNGNNISNNNSGNVGVGTTAPATKLDVAGVTRAQAFNLSGVTAEKAFSILWNNGVANQKVQIYWPASTQVDGIFEITVTGHYWFSNSNGGIQKRIVINGRNIGIINMQQSEVPFRLGFTGSSDTISNIMWDAANSRYYFIVANLDNAQNGITIHVRSITPGPNTATADNLNITPIYTTDATAYPQLFTSFMSGNVGVGTNTPGYKLDVQGGQINASGGLCIAGDCKTAWSQVGGGGSSQWTTSGSNIYYNTGRVGIGVTSPLYTLDVQANSQWAARFRKTDATNGGIIIESATGFNPNVAMSVNGTVKWYLLSNSSNSDALQFWESSGTTPRFTLTQAGNVGIGTINPTQKLEVSGNAVIPTIFGSSAAGGTLSLQSTSHATKGTIQIGVDQTTTTSIGQSGTPGNKLIVASDRLIVNNSAVRINGAPDHGDLSVTKVNITNPDALQFRTTSPVITSNGSMSFNVNNMNSDNVRFNVQNSSISNAFVIDSNTVTPARLFDVRDFGNSRFTVTGAGNVGVGNPAPGFKLDVQGGLINSSGGLCIAGDCKTSWSQVGGSGSSQWTTAGSTIHYNTGNVGVGTASPVFDANTGKFFTVDGGPGAVGSIGAAGGTPNPNTAVGQVAFVNSALGTTEKRLATIVGSTDTGANSGSIDFYTASGGVFTAPRMRINSSGNVGIGTTLPGNKLHVAGGTRVDGGNGRVYLGAGAVNGARGFEIIEENATTFSLRHHDPNVAWQNIVINPHGGNVGIGTLSPTTKLHVAGDGKVTGSLTVDGNIAAKYQDLAEWVPATRALPPGTVVTLNLTQSNLVEASSKAYDTSVAGVISAQPGIALGERSENKVLVATTGRVRIKVDATKGPIQIGDLLVTSDVEGFAMKSQAIDLGGIWIHRPGTIIGKALEPLASGRGEILVLLSLQ